VRAGNVVGRILIWYNSRWQRGGVATNGITGPRVLTGSNDRNQSPTLTIEIMLFTRTNTRASVLMVLLRAAHEKAYFTYCQYGRQGSPFRADPRP